MSTPAGDQHSRRGRSLIGGLAITQTIGYGTLHYAIVVLLTSLAADLHTSTTTITGAFTASVLTGASSLSASDAYSTSTAASP